MVNRGGFVSTEETITVTLPLEVAGEAAKCWDACIDRSEMLTPWARELYRIFKASLPKPKSPEQVVEEGLRRRGEIHYQGRLPTAYQAVGDLREAGWLRDTPEKT